MAPMVMAFPFLSFNAEIKPFLVLSILTVFKISVKLTTSSIEELKSPLAIVDVREIVASE